MRLLKYLCVLGLVLFASLGHLAGLHSPLCPEHGHIPALLGAGVGGGSVLATALVYKAGLDQSFKLWCFGVTVGVVLVDIGLGLLWVSLLHGAFDVAVVAAALLLGTATTTYRLWGAKPSQNRP